MESEQGQQLTGKQVDLMEIDVDEQQELAMQYKVSNKTSRGSFVVERTWKIDGAKLLDFLGLYLHKADRYVAVNSIFTI